jgi:hypothetical protein
MPKTSTTPDLLDMIAVIPNSGVTATVVAHSAEHAASLEPFIVAVHERIVAANEAHQDLYRVSQSTGVPAEHAYLAEAERLYTSADLNAVRDAQVSVKRASESISWGVNVLNAEVARVVAADLSLVTVPLNRARARAVEAASLLEAAYLDIVSAGNLASTGKHDDIARALRNGSAEQARRAGGDAAVSLQNAAGRVLDALEAVSA